MHAMFFALLLSQTFFALLVQATLYVIQPRAGSTCSGGKPCTVEWLDDGTAPLLSRIGPSFIGLYNGDGVLVQQIAPVDLAAVRSVQITPDPNAGPNSDRYYINFTSVNPIGNPPAPYSQYSPNFKLDSMAGSLESPVASDTSAIPVPSSVLSQPPGSISVTITVGGSSAADTSATPTSASSSDSAPSSATSSPSGTDTDSASTTPSSAPTTSISASASDSSSAAPATSSSASASDNTSTPANASSTIEAAPTDSNTPSSASGGAPTTTLTVEPTANGFTTVRTTSTALVPNDSAPTAPASNTSGDGGSTSGGARAVFTPSFASASLSSAAVLVFALLL